MNIDKYIKNLDLNNDKYIIVGVSTGPDSMALLHMLQKNLNCKIVCAHINHNIRKQSIKEEKYLKEYINQKDKLYRKLRARNQ